MKRFYTFFALILFYCVACFSCKKDYNCTCTLYQSINGKPAGTTTRILTVHNTKGDAQGDCERNAAKTETLGNATMVQTADCTVL